MIDNRRGKFTVTLEIIRDAPEAVRQVMGKVIVIRAECMYLGTIEYIAISPLFDKVKFGEAAPEYEVILTTKMKGNKSVTDKITFKRRK